MKLPSPPQNTSAVVGSLKQRVIFLSFCFLSETRPFGPGLVSGSLSEFFDRRFEARARVHRHRSKRVRGNVWKACGFRRYRITYGLPVWGYITGYTTGTPKVFCFFFISYIFFFSEFRKDFFPPPPPYVNSFVLGPAVINTHTFQHTLFQDLACCCAA
jgi:hypothetical protein